MTSSRTGIYPGTFDPVTNGHLDLIRRATRVVDRLIIAVAVNAGKEPLFSLDERIQLMEHETAIIAKSTGGEIEVRPFDKLLVDFVQEAGASIVVRGLRAVSDFEYEFQMTGMNARLAPDVETVFLMASEKTQFISSRLIKEISALGGDVSQFVTPDVESTLKERFAAKKAAE
ncbi:MAG: pantetheine-phosphate adenylyltransferase [Proteobacteria bacterium]|nr:pantetheine-phosphate adenylyltransferase [Pseudomonadota bacterium]